MSGLITGASLVTFVLGVLLLEFLLLALRWRRTGRGLAPASLFLRLAPGACLLLALHATLRGDPVAWMATWLTLAGLAHLLDLVREFRP